MKNILVDFLETEICDEFAKSNYLLIVSDVLAGHHKAQELSGNAYHLRVTVESVYIENLWDDEVEIEVIPTQDFFDILTAFPS
jgi:hypothetical protein